MQPPFNTDAHDLSDDLNQMAFDIASGNLNGYQQDVQTYNDLATKVNTDCHNATDGVDGQ